jgi:uncharacterized OsmC-like protein
MVARRLTYEKVGRMSIRDAVANASAYLTAHPDEARYRDAPAIAKITSGLGVTVSGPGGESATTDMPAGIGGGGAAPSPGWLMRAAAASCVASLVAIRAATVGTTVGPIEVTVDSESDDRGILGLDEAIDAGALSMKVVVSFGGADVGQDGIRELVDWAVLHCPVTDTVARAVPIEVEIR